ncbi:MAG: hypothetical protein ACRD26_08175, partial [Vicinamibacterales bacterium]
ARLLGREHLLSREEVDRLQGLRGLYGIAAPAAICTDPSQPTGDEALCQVLEAPASSTERLVPDVPGLLEAARLRSSSFPPSPSASARQAGASRDGEIRLTYRELTALIADAVRNLRD